jgi:DNA sulfur modification protein DndD
MIIEKIALENIGSYRGINVFDLSINSPTKNVILIGGENGAGKTTFLNSIKLGLFGCYSYGYKTENNEYFSKVFSFLNAPSRKIETEPFSIAITYMEVENYQRHSYTIKRNWQLSGKSIKEDFIITKDGTLLNEEEKDIYHTKLKEYFPPKLFDLCLFDGEEISRIISENTLSSYLQELSTIVFNLDLFNNLEKDLSIYLKQAVSENLLSSLEQEVLELQDKQKEITVNINKLNALMMDESAKITYLNESYESVKKDFETYGGLVKEEREQLNTEMLEIEYERRKNLDEVRDFIQNFLPFYMNKELLMSAKKQIEDEEKLNHFSHLSKELTVDKLTKLSLDLPDGASLEMIAPLLREQILDIIKPKSYDVTPIHLLSPAQKMEIEHTVQTVDAESNYSYVNLLENNREMLVKTKELRQKISKNDSADEFNLMLEKMEKIKEEIFTLEKSIEQIKTQLRVENEQLIKIENLLYQKEQTLNQGNKKKNSFTIAQNMLKLSSEFQKGQHQKKLHQVQIQAISMLNKLMRKQNYITSIRINPETYDVSLFDATGDYIAKETLSAGEKEILLLALIWAIFKCSGRRVPFIFDTLLGRLDKTHKHNILVDFIPTCGEQVLILSTNSEIDEDYYKLLHNYVSHRYLLEYDLDERKTIVSSQYFNFQKQEVTS